MQYERETHVGLALHDTDPQCYTPRAKTLFISPSSTHLPITASLTILYSITGCNPSTWSQGRTCVLQSPTEQTEAQQVSTGALFHP